jgi:hypothetical protein
MPSRGFDTAAYLGEADTIASSEGIDSGLDPRVLIQCERDDLVEWLQEISACRKKT